MTEKVRLSPPPQLLDGIPYHWKRWFEEISSRLGGGPFLLKSYSRTSLPSASEWGSVSAGDEFSSIIYVPNASGGETIAWSNGTNWISARTGAAV